MVLRLEFLVDVVWVRRLFGLGEVAVFVRLELAGAEIGRVPTKTSARV